MAVVGAVVWSPSRLSNFTSWKRNLPHPLDWKVGELQSLSRRLLATVVAIFCSSTFSAKYFMRFLAILQQESVWKFSTLIWMLLVKNVTSFYSRPDVFTLAVFLNVFLNFSAWLLSLLRKKHVVRRDHILLRFVLWLAACVSVCLRSNMHWHCCFRLW